MGRAKQDLTVAPIGGLAPWIGGKRNLAERLVARIERIDHQTYAEPFVGMGGVFLRRRLRARNEVINDRSGDVVNLFRVYKHHPEAFLEQLRLQLFSRREFERLCRTDPTTLTDVQRAARFYWMQRSCYSGLPVSRSFAVARHQTKAADPTYIARLVRSAHARLAKVTIENLPYEEFICRYDLPRTLFYLDPPYWGHETDYGKGLFERADFGRLADLLKGLRGTFILSLNDRPEVHELFSWARRERVKTIYSAAPKAGVSATELIITPRRR